MSARWSPLVDGAPFRRAWFEVTLPAWRVAVGFAMLAWSWAGTVTRGGWVLEGWLGGSALGVADRYMVALVWAVSTSGIEYATRRRHPLIFWGVVALADAPLTAWLTFDALHAIVTYRVSVLPPWGLVVLWVVSAAWGIVAAWGGERLLCRED